MITKTALSRMVQYVCTAFAVAFSFCAYAGKETARNPPECDKTSEDCGCETGKEVSDDCIKANLALGKTTPWTESMPCALKVFADSDSPNVFSQDSLYAVLGGYTFKRLGPRNLSDGVTPAEVVLAHPNGEPVHFVFKDGESIARPDPGVHIKMDERLMMVDAEGWAATKDPVYYDLYIGDGSRRRFLATNMTGALGKLVSVTTPRGVTMTPADMGIDIIYDSNGVRQFLTPSRLADVTPFPKFKGYEVKVYAIQEKPSKDPATGLYVPPHAPPVKHLQIRPENGWRRAIVTLRSGENDPKRYIFTYAMSDWSLAHSSGVEERKEREVLDSVAAYIKSETVSAAGKVLSRKVKNYSYESWGYAVTNKVEGFGGVTDTTSWTYYKSGNGKGQVKTELRQSGLLIEYAYDSLDRVISEKRSGPDIMTEVTTFGYAPVDPSDPMLPVDTRPRTVVKTLNGIECERTYYVYSPLTNIVERVGTQGAAFGSTNTLRTVMTYYPVEGGQGIGNGERNFAQGLIKSRYHADGKLDLYDYSLTDGVWTETVTHVHEESPSPVGGKTMRDIMLTNARGEVIEKRSEAFVENAWHVISRERMTYNIEGKRIRLENLAGQVTTTTWDCCHKISEVQPDGSTTTWDYDDEGRMIASSRLIPLDMTNVTWLTTCYEYDELGQQTATWQTNLTANVGLPVTRTRYDVLGRVVARVDHLGNTTTTTYSPDGLTVTVTNPNTSTSVVRRSADGDIISITGTAVTPEFHTYGILADGTRSRKSVRGETANSSRFTKRYENLLGQTIREERSGFQGTTLATTHIYDTLGRLVSTVADHEPTNKYTYDLLGNRVATTRLVGRVVLNAPQSATATTDISPVEWRKTETSSSFVLNAGLIWLTQSNIVSCSDATITPLVTSSSRQLTGLTAALPSRSRTTDVRGNVTENEMLVDLAIVTSRQTVPYATNKPFIILRYGVELQTVSVSAVTNTIAYDYLGRQISNTDGRGNATRIEYDDFSQRSASIDALGNRTTYGYDQFGNLVAVTNPLGNAIVYEYDLRGRKTYEGGATYPVRYTYDVFGNKTTMMTYRDEKGERGIGNGQRGDVTTWFYDEASGVMTSKVYADGKGPTYGYTLDGKLSRRTWARGIVTDYSYDGWGNLTNTVYSDDTPTVSLKYDALDRQIEAHDAAGVTTFIYDSFGSVTNETVIGIAGTNTIERSYDNFGRLQYNSDLLLHYGENGLLVSVSNHLANAKYRYAVNNIDEGCHIAVSDGIALDRTLARDFVRDSTITNITSAIDGTTIENLKYKSDVLNRPIFRNEDAFGYNDRSEVVSATIANISKVYRYDEIGNSSFFEVNGLNQYSEYEYDSDGNHLSCSEHTFVYDGENRLTTVLSNGVPIVSNHYDAKSRRVKKVTPEAITTFFYDDWNLIEERIAYANGTTSTVKYYWGKDLSGSLQGAGGVGGLLYLTVDGVIYIPCYDNNGNITKYVDANGNVVASYTYDAFGKLIAKAGVLADFFRHRFSTKYFDIESRLYYYGYRFYHPILMRWLNRDPIEEEGGLNLYAFCKNSAPYKFDLLGNIECCRCTYAGNYHSKGDSTGFSTIDGRKCFYLSEGGTIDVIDDIPCEPKYGSVIGNCLAKRCRVKTRYRCQKIYAKSDPKKYAFLWSFISDEVSPCR